jgi:hypothetical protein
MAPSSPSINQATSNASKLVAKASRLHSPQHSITTTTINSQRTPRLQFTQTTPHRLGPSPLSRVTHCPGLPVRPVPLPLPLNNPNRTHREAQHPSRLPILLNAVNPKTTTPPFSASSRVPSRIPNSQQNHQVINPSARTIVASTP